MLGKVNAMENRSQAKPTHTPYLPTSLTDDDLRIITLWDRGITNPQDCAQDLACEVLYLRARGAALVEALEGLLPAKGMRHCGVNKDCLSVRYGVSVRCPGHEVEDKPEVARARAALAAAGR